jgi:hypothetical protein
VDRAAANIAARQQPVGSKLPLDAQVPLVHHSRFRLEDGWTRGQKWKTACLY